MTWRHSRRAAIRLLRLQPAAPFQQPRQCFQDTSVMPTPSSGPQASRSGCTHPSPHHDLQARLLPHPAHDACAVHTALAAPAAHRRDRVGRAYAVPAPTTRSKRAHGAWPPAKHSRLSAPAPQRATAHPPRCCAGHHAERAEGAGFCIFNNVAVAAAHAKAVHGVERVAIVDFDVSGRRKRGAGQGSGGVRDCVCVSGGWRLAGGGTGL